MNRKPQSPRLLLAPSMLVALLAGCGAAPDADQTGAPSPTEASAPALPWTLDEAALTDQALTAKRDACGPAPYAAEVHWSLQPAHGAQPQLWIVKTGEDPKLWIAPSQRQGFSETGSWLNDQTILYLVDGTGNSVIDRVAMGDIACT